MHYIESSNHSMSGVARGLLRPPQVFARFGPSASDEACRMASMGSFAAGGDANV